MSGSSGGVGHARRTSSSSSSSGGGGGSGGVSGGDAFLSQQELLPRAIPSQLFYGAGTVGSSAAGPHRPAARGQASAAQRPATSATPAPVAWGTLHKTASSADSIPALQPPWPRAAASGLTVVT